MNKCIVFIIKDKANISPDLLKILDRFYNNSHIHYIEFQGMTVDNLRICINRELPIYRKKYSDITIISLSDSFIALQDFKYLINTLIVPKSSLSIMDRFFPFFKLFTTRLVILNSINDSFKGKYIPKKAIITSKCDIITGDFVNIEKRITQFLALYPEVYN